MQGPSASVLVHPTVLPRWVISTVSSPTPSLYSYPLVTQLPWSLFRGEPGGISLVRSLGTLRDKGRLSTGLTGCVAGPGPRFPRTSLLGAPDLITCFPGPHLMPCLPQPAFSPASSHLPAVVITQVSVCLCHCLQKFLPARLSPGVCPAPHGSRPPDRSGLL